MKQAVLAVSCMLLLFSFVYAQKTVITSQTTNALPAIKLKNEPRFYVNIHAGYALALGSTFKFYPDDITAISVTRVDNNPGTKKMSYTAPKKGLGEGFRIGAGISYVLNDFLNVGLDIDYFRSTIRKSRDSTDRQLFTSGTLSEKTYTENYSISYNAVLLTFSPNITFKAISRPKWFLYNKIGAVLTFRPNSIEHENLNSSTKMNWNGFIKDSTASLASTYEWGIKNPSLGFMGAIGVQVKMNERIRLFSELQFSHVVFIVKKRTTTSVMQNGVEMVESLPVSEREIDFEKDFNTENFVPDPNKPSRAVTQRIPITYVALQVGIVYRF